jgi:hypothetical protein
LKAPEPFELRDCALITISLAKSAQNLRELRDRVGEVPPQSIEHHFYETLLRPSFDDPEYDNDFALWARRSLHDAVLAERLGIVDPLDYPGVEELRLHLLDVLEDRLAESPSQASALPGREFHFLRSQLVVFPAQVPVSSPEELARSCARLSTGSIYFHFVDARRRTPERSDDFSAWLRRWGDGFAEASDALAAVDIHHESLVEMRTRIAAILARATRREGAP